jgi:hypothetical protein
MSQLKFFALDSTGQPKLTQSGSKAATIIRQLNQAIIDNRDYSFGWFKGLNVETTDANAYEFADELREYAKFNAKKSIWDNTLATGNYFKWDYYAQESRATASLNIVDTEFIDDRAFQIKTSEQNGDSNFIEYYGRYQPELFEISDVYYTTTQLQTFQDAGQQPPIPPAPGVMAPPPPPPALVTADPVIFDEVPAPPAPPTFRLAALLPAALAPPPPPPALPSKTLGLPAKP